MIHRFALAYTPGQEDRMVSVYVPEGGGRFPVMYMFDGQNAFEDGEAAYGRSWNLDTFLSGWGKGMILVAMQSSMERDRRLSEYCPYHLVPRLWEGLRGHGRETLAWIVDELKPRIDAEFPTLPERACTGVMGASMGALMSLYAVTARNDVFSKAACVSPALSSCYVQALRQIKGDRIDPDTRVYLSWGECESRDARSLAHTSAQHLEIANLLMAQGARVYPYLQEEGRHCEADWSRQTGEAMRFLWLE